MWDVALPAFALLIAAGCTSLFRWRERTLPRRQRRRIARLKTVRLADARPEVWVRIAVTVARVERGRCSFVVRDASGAALVHGGHAHADEAAPALASRVAAGDRLVVVGRPRRADGDEREIVSGDRVDLVFAGSDAHPLFLFRDPSG